MVKRWIDPRAYNGATLIGLRGVVWSSHGSADALVPGRRALAGLCRSRAWRARQDRATDGDDAASDTGAADARDIGRKHRARSASRTRTGSHLPAQVLTNHELARRIDNERRVDLARERATECHQLQPGR
jgi:hypothetical protein